MNVISQNNIHNYLKILLLYISLFISTNAAAVFTVEVTRHKPGFGKSEWDGADFKSSFRKCVITAAFASGILWPVASSSYVMCEFQLDDSS